MGERTGDRRTTVDRTSKRSSGLTKKTVLLVAAAVALQSCASARPSLWQGRTPIRPATAGEIRGSLVGMWLPMIITPEGGGEVIVALTDAHLYCSDYTYYATRHRLRPAKGAYRIEDGRLCTTTPAQGERCSYVSLDAEGRLYFGDDPVGATAVQQERPQPTSCSG